MSAATITKLSTERARARRTEIIREAGGDEREFRDRAEAYTLSAHELALFDELEALNYLLGE